MRLIFLALFCAACTSAPPVTGVSVGTYLLAVGEEPFLDVLSPNTGYRELRLDVGGRPTALTVTRDGQFAVVAHEGGVSLRPLFGQPGARTHALEATPTAVAMATRRKCAALATANELLLVSLGTGAIEERYPTRVPDPLAVVVEGRGHGVLVVGSRTAALVSRFDGSIERLPFDQPVSSVAPWPGSDGADVWVEGARLSFRFDTGALTPKGSTPGRTITAAGYEARGALTLAEEGTTGPATALLRTGDWVLTAPEGIVALRTTPGATRTYAALPATSEIVCMDLRTGEALDRFAAPPGVHSLALTHTRRGLPPGG